MRSSDLRGVFAPLVTPFDEGLKVDDERLRGHVRWLMGRVEGLVCTSDVGEFVHLTETERVEVWRSVMDEVDGRVPVIVGSGSSSTKVAKELTLKAAEMGVDAALVVDPYFYRSSGKERYEHFQALDALGLPLINHNVCRYTGAEREWWTTEGIAALENVIGILDATGDMAYTATLTEKVDDAAILAGKDEVAAMALAQGCSAAVPPTANFIPDLWSEIYAAIGANDLDSARSLQMRIQKTCRISHTCPHHVAKAALWMMGRDMGRPAPPALPGDNFLHEDWDELRHQLAGLGLLDTKKVRMTVGDASWDSTVASIPHTPDSVDLRMLIGEAYSGPSAHEAAHVDLLIGSDDGPVGRAYDASLLNDREGRVRELMSMPRCMVVPTVTARTAKQKRHMELASAGVVQAVEEAVGDGFLPRDMLDRIRLIANVFVHPGAANERRIRVNNYKAMRNAIRRAVEGRPHAEELVWLKDSVRHPTRYTP